MLFSFLLITDLNILILAVISQIFDLTAKLVITAGIPKEKAKVKIEPT